VSSADGGRLAATGESIGGIYLARILEPVDTNQVWTSIASSADGAKLAVCALGGSVYTSTNAGATWLPSTITNTPWAAMAGSADGNTLYAAASNGTIYVSANAGISWSKTAAPLTNWSAIAVSGDGTTLAAAATKAGVFISTNSGAAWVHSGAPNLVCDALALSADGSVLAASESGGPGGPGSIYTSTNVAGATGAVISFRQSVPAAGLWTSLACSADGSQIAGAIQSYDPEQQNGGPIYRSADFGFTWTRTGSPVANWTAIASSADGTRLAAAALSGAIYFSIDAGSSWAVAASTATNWTSMALSADGSKLAASSPLGALLVLDLAVPAPSLSLSVSGASLLFSWPIASTNFVLRQNFDLATTNWVALSNAPQNIYTNLETLLVLPVPATPAFFRLKSE